jgi:hypothetical protein
VTEVVDLEVLDGVNSGRLCMVCKMVLAQARQVIGLPHRPQKLCLHCYQMGFAEWNNQIAPKPQPVPALPAVRGRLDTPHVRVVNVPAYPHSLTVRVVDSGVSEPPRLPAPPPKLPEKTKQRRRLHK